LETRRHPVWDTLSGIIRAAAALRKRWMGHAISLGNQSITVQGIGESRYGANAGASASLSLSNRARLYLNYDGKFRTALQSHQGTLGLELKW